jgi:hypothetical protein
MDLGAPAGVIGEGSNKRPRGSPANVGHFHDEECPEHLVQVIFSLTLVRAQSLRHLCHGSIRSHPMSCRVGSIENKKIYRKDE